MILARSLCEETNETCTNEALSHRYVGIIPYYIPKVNIFLKKSFHEYFVLLSFVKKSILFSLFLVVSETPAIFLRRINNPAQKNAAEKIHSDYAFYAF